MTDSTLIDVHVHLESYEPDALDEMIRRARDRGIGIIIANGITSRSSARSAEIAAAHPDIWATVGLHPFYAERLVHSLGDMTELIALPRVVGLGEIGLDFFRHPETREAQIRLFRDQLAFARDRDLPCIVHTKAAHRETKEEMVDSGLPGNRFVIQGFRDGLEILADWLELGCFLSLGPTILNEPTEALIESIRQIPPDRLLLETDSRAQRTRTQGLELATLRSIAERVADIRQVSLEELARLTSRNAREVFRFDERHKEREAATGRVERDNRKERKD